MDGEHEGRLDLGKHLLDHALAEKLAKDAQLRKREEEKRTREAKRLQELQTARENLRDGKKLRVVNLRALLRDVSDEEDPKLPTTADELLKLWEERRQRLFRNLNVFGI